MKLPGIFRFEFAYPLRRLSTWLPFIALAVAPYFSGCSVHGMG